MGLPQGALEDSIYALALHKLQVVVNCNHCLTDVVDLKKCSACKSVSYCSQECQRSDWKLHKFECKAIQAHTEVPEDAIRLAMRILALYNKQDFGEVTEDYIPGGSRSFLSLEDHDDKPYADLEYFVEKFLEYSIAPHPDPKVLRVIFRKISINSFAVSNSFGYPIGIALCIKLSAVNHSCKPSTRVCYRKRTALLAPVNDEIPASLERACHSYIDELMPKSMRQSQLKSKYNFDCSCEGCMDDERNALMEAYSCGNCETGWMENTEDSHCVTCGWRMSKDHYDLCRTAEESAIASRPKLHNYSIPTTTRKTLCEKLLELYENTLHKTNVHRLPVLRCMFELCLSQGDVKPAIDASVAMIKLLTLYQSQKDPSVLYAKFQLSQLFISTEAFENALGLLQEIKGPLEKIYTKDTKILRAVYMMTLRAQSKS